MGIRLGVRRGPKCSNCGNRYWDLSHWSTEPGTSYTLECTNCLEEREVTPRQPKVDEDGLTPKQREIIDLFKTRALRFWINSKGEGREREIKEFKVEAQDYNDDVCVTLEVGMVGDEGTLAASLARDRWLFWVGPRGGMKSYIWTESGTKKTRGFWNVLHLARR